MRGLDILGQLSAWGGGRSWWFQTTTILARLPTSDICSSNQFTWEKARTSRLNSLDRRTKPLLIMPPPPVLKGLFIRLQGIRRYWIPKCSSLPKKNYFSFLGIGKKTTQSGAHRYGVAWTGIGWGVGGGGWEVGGGGGEVLLCAQHHPQRSGDDASWCAGAGAGEVKSYLTREVGTIDQHSVHIPPADPDLNVQPLLANLPWGGRSLDLSQPRRSFPRLPPPPQYTGTVLAADDNSRDHVRAYFPLFFVFLPIFNKFSTFIFPLLTFPPLFG